MRTTKFARFAMVSCDLVVLVMAVLLSAAPAGAADLRVMRTGVGSGTITGTGINCGDGATDCVETYASGASVTLTAAPVAGTGSTFVGWGGDCSGTATTCTVNMNVVRSVRAAFGSSTPIPLLSSFTPAGISAYLSANPAVNTPAKFISALPLEYRQNWVLMPRSESLQTGTAQSPRILLPSASSEFVFTVGMTTHSSYPGAHPNAIEYMQWDPAQKNFRFHEIVLDAIDPMGDDIDPGPGTTLRFPARSRRVSVDDHKCFACHSTRNVLNRGTTPGTDGIPPASVGSKNKPNWDTYDSWGGMLSFNRDRIYQGSVEAAAFRTIFNLWTWQTNDPVRSVIEQLELQPPGVPAGAPDHRITRDEGGGANDGHIRFGFDPATPPVTTEPFPTGADPATTTAYSFDRVAGTGMATSVVRGGSFVTLHHSLDATNDEGRGVELFDRLSAGAGPNPLRIADELVNHRVATGNVPTDVRPIALAIAQRCITVGGGTNLGDPQTVTSTPPLSGASTAALSSFFNPRHGITSFNQLYDDTRLRAWSLTLRKADIQKIDLDRSIDPYVLSAVVPGLIQQYGAATSGISGGTGGTDISLARLRQEVFRRPPIPVIPFAPDSTVMGGVYVDRELISNTEPVALFRYFLEPLGVSIDKWSMGVRGRSRTYTFADLFGGYTNTLAGALKASLGIPLTMPSNQVCATVIPMVDTVLATLPPASGPGAVPTFTDIQRIFNKSCIECHGGLGYPPYQTYDTFLDFSEDEKPPAGDRRLTRSYNRTLSVTSAPMGTDVSNSYLFQRITGSTTGLPPHLYNPLTTDEDCPFGIMPCGGPPLSSADIETIRRWIIGSRPYTEGDPHIKTVDGTSYDFQSAGEFVLLRDEGMELQARQTPVTTAGPLGPNPHTGLSSCVSVNTAVALRVGGHRVTYQPRIPPRQREPDVGILVLRIDGKERELGTGEILLPSGGRILRTTAPGGLQIDYPGGTTVVVTPGWWAHHQIWYMNIDVRHGRATEGVMGLIAPGSWLPALPDGSLLGPRPASLAKRYQELYERFADAWRLTDSTSLFDYEAGLSTRSFTLDRWPLESPTGGACSAPPQPGGPLVNSPPRPMELEEAQRICSDVADPERRANCIVDAAATGERSFAATYMTTEEIDHHVAPVPPKLGFPADFALDLPAKVQFTWEKTSDARGTPLKYRHCIWPVGEEFSLEKCREVSVPSSLLRRCLDFFCRGSGRAEKRLQLAPGKDYFWKVVAEDEAGALVESQTRRFSVKG